MWFDLGATDAGQAREFYRALFGWAVAPAADAGPYQAWITDGEQPWVRPGDDYEYTSGAVLETALGTMRGSYQMIADDGTHFDAHIPAFVLSIPRTLH